MANFRIGFGFDVHSFSNDGKPLIIGGVKIPYRKGGLLAHSDGDVLIHALIDSLLGASGLGDIGELFSNKDSKYKDINSRILLKLTWEKIKKKYNIKNIDITLIAQKPKFTKYIKKMRLNISKDLNIKKENINIKSTTTEKLGFIGRKEGLACQAIVLIYKNHNFFKILKKFFSFKM